MAVIVIVMIVAIMVHEWPVSAYVGEVFDGDGYFAIGDSSGIVLDSLVFHIDDDWLVSTVIMNWFVDRC